MDSQVSIQLKNIFQGPAQILKEAMRIKINYLCIKSISSGSRFDLQWKAQHNEEKYHRIKFCANYWKNEEILMMINMKQRKNAGASLHLYPILN
jgi:hypothetical protein